MLKSVDDLKQNSKAVTQDDVAKRAGVSRSIVSYVLNGGPRPVAAKTKEKIIKAIEELGYRPNKYAQGLMKSQNNSVADKQFGIVLCDVFMLRRPYYADILAGIHSTAHSNNHHIRFMRFFQDLKDPLLFNELIHREEISGLILIALNQSIQSDEDKKLISQIQEQISNIVCIEWEWDNIPSVNFNRQEAANKACSHLISQGYKKIQYIGPADNRYLGYQQAFLEAGITMELPPPLYGSNLVDGYNLCQQIITDNTIPEAIVGGTDEVSIGILRSLDQNKITVPNQIAIVSIDNIEIASFTNPPLSSVNVQTEEMGKMAVQILMNHAANPDIIAATTMLPTELIIRDSSIIKK